MKIANNRIQQCCLLIGFLGLMITIAQAQNPTFTNPIGMEFVQIPAGEFLMGTPKPPVPADNPDTERDESLDWMDDINLDELPQHNVRINQSFYLGKYEVTQAEWAQVMGNNPSYFNTERLKTDSSRNPVDSVTWLDVQTFIQQLNKKDPSSTYRLPTEAEWEYACRAGTYVDYDLSTLRPYGWFDRNSTHKTKAVGSRDPNAWGLYDMQGNVWEWCQDWYDREYYQQSPTVDPPGPQSGQRRVMRGGGIYDSAEFCKAAYRGSGIPDDQSNSMGFRLVRMAK